MHPTDYMNETPRTLSTLFEARKVTRSQVHIALQQAKAAGERLSAIKKALFYGKGPELVLSPAERFELPDHIDPTLLHMAIGKVTEAIEVLELFMTGAPIDPMKIRDEVGDGLWYDSHMLRLVGDTFEDAMAANIAKLKARFPEKFVADAALNHDAKAELEALKT